jgi:hypothetical protein
MTVSVLRAKNTELKTKVEQWKKDDRSEINKKVTD